MDYIISEDRLIKLVDKYITLSVGELIERESSHQLGDEKDFDIVDKNGNMIFQYFRKHLGVSQYLFVSISDLFSINQSVTENLFQRWFEQKYPDLPIKDVYHSIYY
jgi:hypothetical protein